MRLIRKWGISMAKIWRNQIWLGNKEFSNCPQRYKSDVEKLMREDVAKGLHTAEEFEEKTGIPYIMEDIVDEEVIA